MDKYNEFEGLLSDKTASNLALNNNADRAIFLAFMLGHAKEDIYIFTQDGALFIRNYYRAENCFGSEEEAARCLAAVENGCNKFFGSKEHKLHIISEKPRDIISYDLLNDAVRSSNAERQVKISYLKKDYIYRDVLLHFCFSTDPAIYAFDVDPDGGQCICTFNNPEAVATGKEDFKYLLGYCMPIRQ